MNEQWEGHEAAVQMSSTVIPPCKPMEDEIPLVELALMLSGGSVPEERYASVTGAVQTGKAPEIDLYSTDRCWEQEKDSIIAAPHARWPEVKIHGFPLFSRRRIEYIRLYHSRSEGASNAFRRKSWVRA